MNRISTFAVCVVLTFVFVSCKNVKTGTLTLNAQKTDKHAHLTEDIWILKPKNFERVSTYIGYQNSTSMFEVQASVSYEKKYVDLQRVKNSFDVNYLKTKRTVLLESREVIFEDSALENGYFSKVRDNRKGTMRYLLAIPKDGVIHNMKGFCMIELEDKYDEVIKESIFSTTFAEKIETKEAFLLVDNSKEENIKFTRDGKFPTDHKDEALIELIPLTDEKYIYDSEIKLFIQNKFKERIETDDVGIASWGKGEYRAKKEQEGGSLMIKVISIASNEKYAVIAFSASSKFPEDMIKFVDTKLFKTVISER